MITKDEFKLIDRVNKRVIISTPKIIEKEFKVKLDFEHRPRGAENILGDDFVKTITLLELFRIMQL